MTQNISMLDEVIEESLDSFARDVNEKWNFGKEREAVGIFAMDHLLPKAKEVSLIDQNSQIAIESRVPQLSIEGVKQKSEVCKDLVIWAKAFENCWTGINEAGIYPLAILEWKANIDRIYSDDVNWLKNYTTHTPTKLGYVITVDYRKKDFVIAFARILEGQQTEVKKIR